MCDVIQGELIGVQDFVAVQVGHGNFSRGNQPEIVLLVVVEVVGEQREIARTFHDFAPHQDRQGNLRVSVLPAVQVQHPRYDRAFQTRAVTVQRVKAAAREFHAALEVDDSETFGQVPVWLCVKIERGGFAPVAKHLVAGFVVPVGCAGVREVGQFHHGAVDALLQITHLVFESVDPLSHFAHLADHGIGRRVALRASLADLPGYLVAPGTQFIALRDGDAAAGVEIEDVFKAILILGSADQRGTYGVSVSPYLFYREHGIQNSGQFKNQLAHRKRETRQQLSAVQRLRFSEQFRLIHSSAIDAHGPLDRVNKPPQPCPVLHVFLHLGEERGQ